MARGSIIFHSSHLFVSISAFKDPFVYPIWTSGSDDPKVSNEKGFLPTIKLDNLTNKINFEQMNFI